MRRLHAVTTEQAKAIAQKTISGTIPEAVACIDTDRLDTPFRAAFYGFVFHRNDSLLNSGIQGRWGRPEHSRI